MKKCGLFALSSVLSLTALFTVFSGNVFAASAYDSAMQTVEELVIEDSTNTYTENISTTYLSLWNGGYDTSNTSATCSTIYSEFISNIETASWVVWTTLSNTSGEQRTYINYNTANDMQLGFHDNGDSEYQVRFASSANVTTGSTGSGDIGTVTIYMKTDGNIHVDCWDGSLAAGNYASDNNYSTTTRRIFLANATVNYPTGYEGAIVADSYNPLPFLNPDVAYYLDDKIFEATYLGPTVLPINFVELCAIDGQSFRVHWNIQDSSETEILDTHTSCRDTPKINHVFELYDDYTLTVTLVETDSDTQIVPTTYTLYPVVYNITVDGSTYNGGWNETTDCEITSGQYVCQAPTPYDLCIEYADDTVSKFGCQLQDSMNLGLINPSINAFKNVLTGLTVPDDPTCDIPLTDVTIASAVIPLSDYSDNACDSAETLRTIFPIFPVLVNFSLAMLILFMLARIINRLTDNTKHDVVEGI